MHNDARHALVVGGTGMLRGVCLHLASRGAAVSVIARDRQRLDRIGEETGGAARGIALDYRGSAGLRLGIEQAIRAHGSIDLAVCWIHSTAPHAPMVVARAVASIAQPCRFFHILGGAAAERHSNILENVGMSREQPLQPDSVEGVLYRRIILGFVVEPAGSRWLSNNEIAGGVIDAFESDREQTIIGVVEPWSARP